MVRGRGYARSLQDFENIVLTASEDGTPIRIKDIGQVVKGPDFRRGVTDLDGTGEVVSGIVVMRQGQNALDVIDRVKAKIKEIEPGLPSGVKIVPIYDRSDLIQRAIDNMKSTLVEVLITVSLVILIFLWHFPSAIIPVITIPVAVLISFIPFRMMGVTANIMSLGGIVIAVGALVDAAIVVVEQIHKKLEQWDRTGRLEDYQEVVVKAVKQVAGPSFFALLVIAVSFLPVLSLESVEGRMFKPLAYTKNLSMIVAAVLAITLDPALRLLFTHMQNFNFRPPWLCRLTNAVLVGTIHPEEKHPISRRLIRVYEPVVTWSLRRKWWVIGGALALVLVTLPVYLAAGLGIYAAPGGRLHPLHALHHAGDFHRRGPESAPGHGPDHQAVSRGGPGPGQGGPGRDLHRPGPGVHAGDGDHPEAQIASGGPHMTQEELISQMNEALKLPGLANAWTMPIKGRIEMLSTGLRTPIGHQDLRGRPQDHRGDRGSDRIPAAGGQGDPQRLRRAHRERLFSRFRLAPGGTGPLRLEHRRGPGRDRQRHRRGKRDHHRGRAGTLRGQCALPAGFPVRLQRPGTHSGAGRRRQAANPPGAAGQHQDGQRAGHDPR